MFSIEDFHEYLVQSVFSSAECSGCMREEAFLEEVSAYLIDESDVSENVQFADYRKTGLEVHGWDYDDERGILTLIVHEFSQKEALANIGKIDIETKFKRLKTFFSKALSGLYKNMEESSPAYEMAYNIYDKKDNFNTIRLLLITDYKISIRSDEDFASEKVLQGYHFEYRILDIDYLYKIYQSQNQVNDYEIDVEKILGHPLNFLMADSRSDIYDSYLLVAPGELIYKIYDTYGQKLLEQNVRTFLQFKGKVNKGLRITLREKPEMFFAYNNGLTATATDIKFTGDKKIKSITGLQIVNGGQTTSAIYAVKRNDKASLENVYVQIKLSVIKKSEETDKFVSKISEYANTQNKVNKSDFFANSPFHKDFKQHSEKIYAPAKDRYYKTRWFYERARGQYLQSIALFKTKAEQNKFKKENPKAQVIEKPMLAKSEMSWMMHPHIVARGAETCFAEFANYISKEIEKDENCITEFYFKSAVAKIIIFKETEKIVSSSTWYNGGYRAQCVTYTIAVLAYLFEQKNKIFDFMSIWEKQEISEELREYISILAEKVYELIMQPVEGAANIGQYCKKLECWDKVKKLANELYIDTYIELLSTTKEEANIKKREAKNNLEIDNSVKMQEFVIKIGFNSWNNILINDTKYNHPLSLSQTEYGVLSSMVSGKINFPTPKQAKVLYNIYQRAKEKDII